VIPVSNSKSWQTIIPVSAVEISYRLAILLARSFSGERDAEINKVHLRCNIFFENFWAISFTPEKHLILAGFPA